MESSLSTSTIPFQAANRLRALYESQKLMPMFDCVVLKGREIYLLCCRLSTEEASQQVVQGAPQGSVLGPLFLTLCLCTNSHVASSAVLSALCRGYMRMNSKHKRPSRSEWPQQGLYVTGELNGVCVTGA